MPKIAICSLFRDNIEDVKRTFVERAKWDYNQNDLIHICIEGDSKDGTYETLLRINGFNTIVERINQNTGKIGSFAEPGRLQALAQLWNRAIDIAVDQKVDYAFILDSDLIVGPDILNRLISANKDVIAPMMLFENSVYFRDTWGYHKDGNDFLNNPPYHKAYNSKTPFTVDGVGCPLMKYEVIKKGARCGDNEIRDLSKSILSLGYLIYVDPKAIIYHPRMGVEIPERYRR